MKNLKKLLCTTLTLGLLFSLAACNRGTTPPDGSGSGSASGAASSNNGDGVYRVGIVKQLDHASIDEIAEAIAEELTAISLRDGITIQTKILSGNGDVAVLGNIGAQLIGDGYDLIIPIATTAAQIIATAAEDSKTPVVYAAVSNPEQAGLNGIDYLTGVSDGLDTAFILDMMLAQNPELQSVGLLYSLSEPNSVAPILQAKEYLDAKGISYVEKTANNTAEVIDAVSSMLDQVDAIFTPTDNVIMSAELAIYQTLIDAGIPHYAGADSFVRNGAFASSGVNYTQLGKYAAQMAADALRTGTLPAQYAMEGDVITVNTETAAGLGVDYSMFSPLASDVVEVVTTED